MQLSIGIKAIRFGTPGATPFANMTQAPLTYRNSCQFNTDSDADVDIEVEEQDAPVDVIVGRQVESVVWEILDITPANLKTFRGGSIVAGQAGEADAWQEPDSAPLIEMSLEVETKRGTIFRFPLVSVKAQYEGNVTKGEPLRLQITAKKLQPMLVVGQKPTT